MLVSLQLTTDLKLKQVERMQKEKKFSKNVETVRATFSQVPERVSLETASHIAGNIASNSVLQYREYIRQSAPDTS